MFDDLVRDLDAHVLDAFGVPAVIAQPEAQQVESIMVVVDKGVQVVAEDGYTTLKQTHLTFSAPQGWEVAKGQEIATANERFRLVQPFSDDGHLQTWVAQKIGAVDLQDIGNASTTLQQLINQEW